MQCFTRMCMFVWCVATSLKWCMATHWQGGKTETKEQSWLASWSSHKRGYRFHFRCMGLTRPLVLSVMFCYTKIIWAHYVDLSYWLIQICHDSSADMWRWYNCITVLVLWCNACFPSVSALICWIFRSQYRYSRYSIVYIDLTLWIQLLLLIFMLIDNCSVL